MSRQRRGRRDFDALTEAQLIAGRTAARRVRVETAPPQTLGELLAAIDHVAEAATGERSFLHLGAMPRRT
ncbi:hypothetical protein [Methylobacterium oxalidis]|uniref:Uncharacterized protein n=1 Tax=Methylobacterium oxalidis TaxID=944322 RepID=A0A512J2W0_9HYPH|nr:hypothetical protein [Methylobacterium oxalidis]GEP04308.1 hypothetical protein MOX02_23460 [Methylobacterium oxalidis]GJE32978.1 hypothetical protein LDDCCGHA_3177 [Methylobacterium oxalidis]GLS67173.1 hypothetical protein GCM10007888_55560 [Methylobacterium oxalidis]